MRTLIRRLGACAAVTTAFGLAGCSSSGGLDSGGTLNFSPVATTFSIPSNSVGGEAGQVAEISAVSPDGRTLVYTDAGTGQVGFVDITNAAAPVAQGGFDTSGEATSVAITPNGRFALVTVRDATTPAGSPNRLLVVDLSTSNRSVVRTLNLPGQPDSIAISPDGRFAAIAIENEGSPGVPGSLSVVDLTQDAATFALRQVTLTGLSGALNPSDPEPEYVDINESNLAAVTLQENNAVAIVDLASGTVRNSFSAGTVSRLADTTEDGTATFDDAFSGRREPDGIAWLTQARVITANEGDTNTVAGVFGGSRDFSVFNASDGAVVFDPNGDLEARLAAANLYPDDRSANRGSEPENVTTARVGDSTFAFIAVERANAVAVYRFPDSGTPVFSQLLPTGVSPEGVVFVPNRNLLITSNEVGGSLSIFRLSSS